MNLIIRQWLKDFNSTVANGQGPTNITHSLIMLGVKEPGIPQDEIDARDSVLGWFELAANQREFNNIAHGVIEAWGIIPKLRRVLLRDLTRGDDEYGKISLKEHSRALLKHFLKASPSTDWV